MVNDYAVGSPAAKLPTKTNPAACAARPGAHGYTISAGSKCFSPTQTTYTVGILGASNTIDVSQSEFMIVGRGLNDPILLEEGRPFPMVTGLQQGASMKFMLIVEGRGQDIIISAESAGGNLTLALAAPSSGAPWTAWPTCVGKPPFVSCTNRIWQQSTGVSSVLQIDHQKPCLPTISSGESIATTCSNTSFSDGQWNLLVYGASADSDIRISYARAGDVQMLVNGVETQGRTTSQVVCTQRVVGTGACSASGTKYAAREVSYYEADLGVDVAKNGQVQVSLARMCQGSRSGSCGGAVKAFTVSCWSHDCTAMQKQPYWGNFQSQISVSSQQEAQVATVSTAGCAGSPKFGSTCNLYIGVFSACDATAGQSCGKLVDFMVGYQEVQGGGPILVDGHCFEDGVACTLPRVAVPPGVAV